MGDEHPIFGEVIHRYTRAQGIADGVLYDLSETAKGYGFIAPTACTAAVMSILKDCSGAGQSYEGRIHDLFWMLRCAIKAKPKAGRGNRKDRVSFDVAFIIENRRELIHLYAVAGPGDDGELVITIMEVGED